MKHRRWLATGLLMVAALLITAGVAYAAGVGAVNNGTDSSADGDYSTVGGGRTNHATGDFSVVAGGGCSPNETYELCLDGVSNVASGEASFVGGGEDNVASGGGAVVAGGGWGGADTNEGNAATATGSAVLGGDQNKANGRFSSVLGGEYNIAGGDYAVVLGGEYSYAEGEGSLAAGNGARALHDGAMVFSTSHRHPAAESIREGEFAVYAEGGIRIITGPGQGIELNGQDVLSLILDFPDRPNL
jgi:hypothetical protein